MGKLRSNGRDRCVTEEAKLGGAGGDEERLTGREPAELFCSKS